YDDLGEPGNALHTADDDAPERNDDQRRGDAWIDAEGILHALGQGVRLNARQQQTRAEDGCDRKDQRIRLPPHGLLDVISRPATVLAVLVLFLVELRKRALHVRRRGT